MVAVSRIVSYLFHPIFMPVVGLALVFHTGSMYDITMDPQLKVYIYYLFLLNTIGMPLISVLMMRFTRMIQSFQMKTRGERTFPFLLVFTYYGLTWWVIRDKGLPEIFSAMIFGMMLTMALVVAINLRFKISVHMIGISGVVGGFLALLLNTGISHLWLFIVLVLLAGLVGTARLFLRAHTNREIYVGATVGFVVQFVVVLYEISP